MEKTVSERLTYHDNQILGKGLNGFVFRGSFDQETIPIAVKRVRLNSIYSEAVQKREEESLKNVDHVNTLKFFHAEQDETFRYFVLELCVASLDQTYLPDNDPKKYSGPIPTKLECLRQMAMGLEHIHSKMLVHRNIKPENILISATEPVVVKLSDFGLCKPIDFKNSSSLNGMKGSQFWMAPEVLEVFIKQQYIKETDHFNTTFSSDIYSLGLVFFTFLTDGLHLFGSKNLISANISRGKPVNLKKLEDGNVASELINGMTQSKPSNRIKLSQVISKLVIE